MPNLTVTPWHGEGDSLFYVVAGSDEDWDVVATFSLRRHGPDARLLAERLRDRLESDPMALDKASSGY